MAAAMNGVVTGMKSRKLGVKRLKKVNC